MKEAPPPLPFDAVVSASSDLTANRCLEVECPLAESAAPDLNDALVHLPPQPEHPATPVVTTTISRADPYVPQIDPIALSYRFWSRCTPCCPLAPAHHSASGLAINICDVLVEEGGPRVEAKRRGGDPLPRASCRAKLRERAGSRVFGWGASPRERRTAGHPKSGSWHGAAWRQQVCEPQRSVGERVVEASCLARSDDRSNSISTAKKGARSIELSAFSALRRV